MFVLREDKASGREERQPGPGKLISNPSILYHILMRNSSVVANCMCGIGTYIALEVLAVYMYISVFITYKEQQARGRGRGEGEGGECAQIADGPPASVSSDTSGL